MKKLFTIPNTLTLFRILGSLCLIFIEPLTDVFFILYTFCGVSDVLDGVIARATGQTSELGSKLDSVADLIYYFVLLLKIFPVLWNMLPSYIWIFVIIVLSLRLLAYIVALLRYKKFASLHTYFNKATGFVLFLVPYMLMSKFGAIYCFTVCAVGGIASLEELIIHIVSKGYNENEKSVLGIKSK